MKKESAFVKDYIHKIKSVANSLSSIGQLLPKVELILQVLMGMGSNFDFIMATITTCLANYSLEDVHDLLLAHEHLMAHQAALTADAPFPSTNQAMHAPTPMTMG